MPPFRPLAFDTLDSIHDVPADDWDRLHDGHPALRHAFLAALEDCGCVGAKTGWLPRYLAGRRDGRLVAAAPLYVKGHSYGEYVFDWAWADAYHRHGLDYYPKLLVASPFSPLPGMRLLGGDDDARRAALAALIEIARQSGLSSLHVLFAAESEIGWMRDAGMLVRDAVQFHWRYRGESRFDDFLAQLNHDKRKKIRQERRRVASYGLDFRWYDGTSAGTPELDFFARCYTDTYHAHRATPYLNADFFGALAQRMPEAIRLLIARRGDQPVASALFLCDRGALYGRYWGCAEALPGLHFELCYYRAIEYCIAHRIARMEGGAQGEHKLSRGLDPVVTRSAHWIADPRIRGAVDRHLALEGRQMSGYVEELETRTPFRRTPE